MDLTIADQYYLKALDAYPFDLADTFENLNYAISYDDEHSPSYCLMGQLYMRYIKQYDKAEYYFNKALSHDLNYPETFRHFILLKIWLSEFSAAMKMIKYAHSIKGMSKALLYFYEANIHEYKGQLKECEIALKKAQDCCTDQDAETLVKKQIARLKAKVKRNRKASKKGVVACHATTS